MITIRRILCATDLSPASEPAWNEAQLLARALDAELVLLHVLPPLPIPLEGYFPPHLYRELAEGAEREARATLDAWLAKLVDPGVKARSRLADGPAALRILDVVREEGSDLVVVGTHGRSGVGRVALGSVADRVLRQATCPVVTVRADVRPEPRAAIRRICYATDFSPIARAAWHSVVTLADAARAEVDLVHVALGPLPDRHLAGQVIGEMARFLDDQARAEAERFLQGSELPRERIHVHIGNGVEADQIVHRAQEREADLIAMGTHGRSGLVRWMLGSVSQRVIQTAPCPVMTIGPGGEHKDGQDAS
jgi:nucleotide-binding universal stress UspA family protein